MMLEKVGAQSALKELNISRKHKTKAGYCYPFGGVKKRLNLVWFYFRENNY